ncbi:MAG: methyltransferase domain-containing protein [Acidiferrobacterales bacterium]|nr:methyltransferase domain-containing protein [Acidiferrobacterales bacterium]
MERYETMYQWNPASEVFYTSARIGSGLAVGDFGCGPGHAAIEFAKRVGETGHIHAFDINTEFVRRARARADRNGLGDRITVHLLEDARIPLPDETLDRIIARNTLIYVADPGETLTEFRRVLKPGGLAHAIEGDWRLTAVEPVPSEEWRALIEAASWAWPRQEIGRTLYGFAREAGFKDVKVQVLTIPDMEGRLDGMIQTVAEYARESGKLAPSRIDTILETIRLARSEGRYLAISPQFVVTASR